MFFFFLQPFWKFCFSLVAWILHFWFTQNFCYRLHAASFCYRSVLYFLSLASLNVVSLRSLCERKSRFRYNPTSILFSMLIFCLNSSWAGVAAAVTGGTRSCWCQGFRVGWSFIVTFSCFFTFSWEWLVCHFWFFLLSCILPKINHFRFYCKL